MRWTVVVPAVTGLLAVGPLVMRVHRGLQLDTRGYARIALQEPAVGDGT